MSKEVKSYTLSPEEVEKILAAKYGDKLEPVDPVKLAKQHQRRSKNPFRK